MSEEFVYLWAFEVRPESIEEFEKLYGPDGAWVELFGRWDGYLGTQLLKDRQTAGRYITVDRWESKEAYGSFRSRLGGEFDRIDRLGEELTVSESSLGEFLVAR